MTYLSDPLVGQRSPAERLHANQLHSREEVAGRFLLKGEDAHWLKKIAKERNMSVDALIMQFAIEGVYRARSNLML